MGFPLSSCPKPVKLIYLFSFCLLFYFDISTPYIICIICFCLFCRLLPYNEISCCLFIPFLDIVCSPPDLLFILFIFVILVCTRVKMK